MRFGFSLQSWDHQVASCMHQSLRLATSSSPPNEVLQRTHISAGCLPWRSVRGVELGR